MLPPLNNPSRLIQLIAKVTDLRPSDVQKRLIAETKKLGHTVSAEIQRRSIKPFVNSPALPLKRIPETRFQSQNCSLVLASAGTREFFGWNSSSRSIKTLTVVMIRSKNQVFFEVGNVKKKTVRGVMCRGLSIITLSC